jgi:hypothetical protein
MHHVAKDLQKRKRKAMDRLMCHTLVIHFMLGFPARLEKLA